MNRLVRKHHEEGSALLLALVFVLFIGIWISALLAFADTAFKASKSVASQRNLVYAADGAMDSVIQKIRTEGKCADIYTAPTTNGSSVKVDCQPPLKPNGHDQFSNPARAFDIGETPVPLTADANLATGAAPSAAIALNGYGPAAPIGPVQSAILIISHHDRGSVAALHAEVVPQPGAGGVVVASSASCSGNPSTNLCIHSDGLAEDDVPVPELVGASLSDVRINYSATLDGGADRTATEALNGIWLKVTYGAASLLQTVILKPTGHNQFESPTNAFQIEAPSPPAVATANLAGGTTASIFLTGYSRLTIPANALIEKAELRVSHGDTGALAGLSATIRPAGSPDIRIDGATTTAGCADGMLCAHPEVREDKIDVKSLGLTKPAQFKSVTVRYEVSTATGVTAAEALDGIWIEISYAPEGLPTADPRTKPKQAILTLGPPTGVHVVSGNSVVRGGVVSDSDVKVDSGGELVLQKGDVVATGACTGKITPPSAMHCDKGSAVGVDPGYLPAITDLPLHRTVPDPSACGPLMPGYYDDAVALSKFTSSAGPCNNKVVWLQPGLYYFNFNFAQRPLGGAACGAECTWKISGTDVHVVAGAKKGDWTDPSNVAFPGGCDPDRDGVQLVFGGESRLDVAGGKTEICPPSSTIDQPQRIAIYGLKATSPPPERATLTPTGHNQFVPADNAFSIDGKNSGARLSSNAATGASIELNTFKSKSGPGIVPNEIVTGAKLRIKHAELGDVEEVKATVTGVGPDMVFSSKAPQCSLCVHPGAAPVEDKIDLPVPPLSATSPVAAMKVRYQVTLASGASKIFSEVLDGIAVDVDHGVPAIPVLPPVASLTSTFEATGHDQFTDPTNAFDIDGSKTADVALASGAATAASLSLSGFDQVSVPPDATINLLILKVAHQETGTTGDVSDIKLTVTPGGGGPPVVVHPAGCADLCDYPVDLKAAGVTTPAALAGLRVRYDVTLATGSNKSATAKLDGAQLDVSYVRVTGDGSTAELVPTGVGPTTGFDNADNALQIESPANAATADAMVTTVSKKASINLMGFFQHTVPSDAVIDEVTLRIAHKEANPADFASLTATVLPQPGPKPVSIEVPSHDTMTEDRINLRALGFDSAAKLAGLEVDYEVTAATGSTGTESLDGVAIEVKYREPRLEALTGCSVTGDCAVFQADVPAKLAVQGTLYTPTAAVSLHLGDSGHPVEKVVLARGVISRSVDLAIEAPPCSSPPPCDPTIMVPDSPSDTKVFTAYLDQNGTIKELLRTTVLFGPQPLPTSVEVKAWSVLI